MPARKKPSSKKPVTTDKASVSNLPVQIREELLSDEFRTAQAKIRSSVETPKSKIKKRPDGFDYVDEAYLRQQLDSYFPTWSWLPSGDNPVQFLGSEWVVVSGSLVINDAGVQRTFFSPGAARVQFKKNLPHTAENVIDIDNNVGSANTYAFKRAVNRLCHIADDVYRKQDLDLTEEQLDMIKDLCDQMNVSEELRIIIRGNVDNGRINKSNFDMQFEQLKNELTQQTT